MTEVTPDNAARATPVAWLQIGTLNSATPADYARCKSDYPGIYDDWFPVYDAATVTALEAEVASLRTLLVSVTNPDGSPNLDAAQLGAAESYRVAAINANSRADAAERRVAELEAALRMARDELGGLPHSLGYEFTHLPKIDEALTGDGAK